jgi:maltooligosyltrehalose synthase
MMLRVINLNLKGATNMELTYRQSGDYLMPDLTLEEQPREMPGKYARMRRRFLKEHRKGQYNALLLSGRLTAHLAEIDRQAREQVDAALARMAAAEGVNEQLKVTDQMEWVRRMNSLKATAEEAVLQELIYG